MLNSSVYYPSSERRHQAVTASPPPSDHSSPHNRVEYRISTQKSKVAQRGSLPTLATQNLTFRLHENCSSSSNRYRILWKLFYFALLRKRSRSLCFIAQSSVVVDWNACSFYIRLEKDFVRKVARQIRATRIRNANWIQIIGALWGFSKRNVTHRNVGVQTLLCSLSVQGMIYDQV